jgi:hypothetical protein
MSGMCFGTINIGQIAKSDDLVSPQQVELLSLCRGLNIIESECICIKRMSENVGDDHLIARELLSIKLNDTPSAYVLARKMESSDFYTKSEGHQLSTAESRKIFLMTGKSFVDSVRSVCGFDITGSK